MVKCKKCKSENIVKNGKVRGKQRYLCKDCRCESRVEKGRQTAQKSRECKYVANKSHKALLRCLRPL